MICVKDKQCRAKNKLLWLIHEIKCHNIQHVVFYYADNWKCIHKTNCCYPFPFKVVVPPDQDVLEK